MSHQSPRLLSKMACSITTVAFAASSLLPSSRRRLRHHLKPPPYCRLHRRAALPPVLPTAGTRRQRAIELLGHCTQRCASERVKAELGQLIGELPPDRGTAQAWKAGLTNLSRPPPPARSEAVAELARLSHIPVGSGMISDQRIGRTFSLLDIARRSIVRKGSLSAEVQRELTGLIGICPRTEQEVLRLTRILSNRVRGRRRSERRPPRLPRRVKNLHRTNMLLGTFEHKGHVGRKSRTLRSDLGALPRTRNVARWWKKLVEARLRKIARRKQARANARIADRKRCRKKLWLALPDWAQWAIWSVGRIGKLWRRPKQ